MHTAAAYVQAPRPRGSGKLQLQLGLLAALLQGVVVLAAQVGVAADTPAGKMTAASAIRGVPSCVAEHVWRATAESQASGHNKPGTCPGCAGQAVACTGCDNIVPLFHLGLSTATSRQVAAALSFQKALPAGSPMAIMPMYSPEARMLNFNTGGP